MGKTRFRERVQVVYLGESAGLHSVLVQPPVSEDTRKELARIVGRAQDHPQANLYTEIRFQAAHERLALMMAEQVAQVVLPERETVYRVEVPTLLTVLAENHGEDNELHYNTSTFLVTADNAQHALILLRARLESTKELLVEWDEAAVQEFVRKPGEDDE